MDDPLMKMKQTVRQALVPQIKTFVLKDSPNPQLAIGGEARVGTGRVSSVLRENKAGKLLLVAAYRVSQVKIDGIPD